MAALAVLLEPRQPEPRLLPAPELHRLLRRAGRPAHRGAIAGAGSGQAPEARLGDPAKARGRRGAADARLAQGILHAVTLREEPGPPQRALQLRADAGGLAGQVVVPHGRFDLNPDQESAMSET